MKTTDLLLCKVCVFYMYTYHVTIYIFSKPHPYKKCLDLASSSLQYLYQVNDVSYYAAIIN